MSRATPYTGKLLNSFPQHGSGMSTLLVLGSKPAPALPPSDAFDAVACANGSGRSALTLGLPAPVLTVMSTVLTSGHKPANDLALQAIRGLRTQTLHLYPRPPSKGNLVKRLIRDIKRYNVKPWYFRRQLRALDYHYDEVIAWSRDAYHQLVLEQTGNDPEIQRLIAQKQPSTGIMALAIGVADGRFDRFVMSGFSFEITHAYAHNPLIDKLGTTASKHADTDIAILQRLALRHGNVFTTEPTVHQRAGIPLVTTVSGAAVPSPETVA